MKTSKLEGSLLLLLTTALSSQGFLMDKLSHGGTQFEYVTGSEARSDETPDGSTVGVSLNPNYTKRCWELRVYEHATGSGDLKAGLDVTAGTELSLELFTYGVGDGQYGRGYYIHGQDLMEFDYSPTLNKLKLKFKPTMPAKSASYSGGWTASAGMDIYFRGTYQDPSEINYGPPVIVGNFLPDDVDRAMHPSSSVFYGKIRNFNGVDGQQGNFKYYLGSRHAAHKGYDLDNSQAYVDGTQPASGFGWSVSTPTIPFTLGASEDFRVYAVYNANWSARDIQVGQMPMIPAFTQISKEPGGIQLYWEADTNMSYTLQSFPALGGSTNVLATNLTSLGFFDSSTTQTSRFYRLLQE